MAAMDTEITEAERRLCLHHLANLVWPRSRLADQRRLLSETFINSVPTEMTEYRLFTNRLPAFTAGAGRSSKLKLPFL